MEDLPKIAGTAPVKHEAEAGKTYAWCTCGLSDKQPFCNGAHRDSGMTNLKVTEEESKDVWLCTCKQTKNPPYCDGSHKAL